MQTTRPSPSPDSKGPVCPDAKYATLAVIASVIVIAIVTSMGAAIGASGALEAQPSPSARTDFTHCLNDSDDDGVKDDCDWSHGASNPNNSAYAEGDAVGQRLFLTYTSAGPHTIEFVYDFTKSDVYAYDFLSNVDDTQPGGLLNQCGQLPLSFVDLPTCTALFSGAVAVPIPPDGFDSMAVDETPAVRNMLIGGASTPLAVTIVDHAPSTPCLRNCGTSAVTVEMTFSPAAPNTPVGIWFGAHLAATSGWGDPFGASYISGAPFHVALGHGGRDNQILIPGGDGPTPTVPEAPFPVLLALSAVGLSTLTVWGGRARRNRATTPA